MYLTSLILIGMQRNTYVRYVKNILVLLKNLPVTVSVVQIKQNTFFPVDFTKWKKTIFDELKEIDIIVNEQDKHFPWFIVFYCEAVLEDLDSNMTTTKLKLERIHRTISVSICSNVPEFIEEHFILEEDVEILLQNMIF